MVASAALEIPGGQPSLPFPILKKPLRRRSVVSPLLVAPPVYPHCAGTLRGVSDEGLRALPRERTLTAQRSVTVQRSEALATP